MIQKHYRFHFGISFAESSRRKARSIAHKLKDLGFEVFFDEYYKHEMIGKDGSIYLRNVYSHECRYCIVLISREYDKKDWTNLEREAIQSRELRGERNILIPVLIDQHKPDWLPATRIYHDLSSQPSLKGLIEILSKLDGLEKIDPRSPRNTPVPPSFLITQEKYSDENLDIFRLANSDPYYRKRDIAIKLTDRELFIDCPEKIKEKIFELDNDFVFNPDKSFHSNDFGDLAKSTGIDNLPDLINKHREIIGEEFLNQLRKRLPIFNGKKFGIYESHFSNTSDNNEYPTAKLRVFTTDYFTHRVFRSIYNELNEENQPISRVNKYDISRYNCFTTSLGVDAFVILRPTEELVFAKRSMFVANAEKPVWHVSVNEALSETDTENRQVSLIKCLTRGLNEELGVREERMEEIKFFNFFLVRKHFEIGVTALIEIDMSFDELVHCYDNAKDSVLETEKIVKIPFDRESINHFFEENYENFSNIAIHALRVLLSREI